MGNAFDVPDEELDEYIDDNLRLQLDLLRELLRESPESKHTSEDVLQRFPPRRLRLLCKLQEIDCILRVRKGMLSSFDVWSTAAALILAQDAWNDGNAPGYLDPQLKSDLESWRYFEQTLYELADQQENDHERVISKAMRDYPDFKLANLGLEFSGWILDFVWQCDGVEVLGDGTLRRGDAAKIFFLLLAFEHGIQLRDQAEANWKSGNAHIPTEVHQSLCQHAWRCLEELVESEGPYIEMPQTRIQRIGI